MLEPPNEEEGLDLVQLHSPLHEQLRHWFSDALSRQCYGRGAIHSYLPHPRVWKAVIAARIGGGRLEVRGAAGAELVDRPASGADLCSAGDDWCGVFHGGVAGIGGLIIAGRERFDMDLVMLEIVVDGSVGFAIDRGATWLERRLIPWQRA